MIHRTGSLRAALVAAFAAPSIAGAAGCSGYTDVHAVVLREPRGLVSDDVRVYMDEQAVPEDFYELAMLQAVGYDGDATAEDVVSALRARGRDLGCDAIVHLRVELGYTIAHGYGVCVKWRTPGAKVPAPVVLPG
ncbi:hypothetical protein [Pendulispora albinea]|uniref:Lipoprotein n=1 Tax=Pendulispora albinea TaxID=2741071 RepID=A0ABZ2M0J4_9BACT